MALRIEDYALIGVGLILTAGNLTHVSTYVSL
jgi:hypothetical protein